MKFKLKNGPASVGQILTIEADKDDELAYVDAERVYRGDLDAFLPFSYDKEGRSYEFSYYIGAGIPLKRILAAPLSPDVLRSMLGSLLHMMQVCEQNGLSRLRVVLDADYVYYDPTLGMLRFAYMPVRSYVSEVGEAGLISRICSSSLADAADQQFAVSVWDFVHRTTILTSVALEDFLEDWGLQSSNAGRKRSRVAHSALGADTRANYGWDFVTAIRQDEARLEAARREAEEEARQAELREEMRRQARWDEARRQAAQSEAEIEDAGAGDVAAATSDAGSEAVAATEDSAATAAAAADNVSDATGGKAPSAGYRDPRFDIPEEPQRRFMLTRVSTNQGYILCDGRHVLGRGADCSISVLDSRGVSRKHAALDVQGEECVLHDLSSTNGVFVDGNRLDADGSIVIKPGTHFLLGEEEFELQL